MKKQYSITEVRGLLRKAMGDRSQKDFAATLGVAPSYLHYMLTGERGIPDSVLAYLGLERKETFIQSRLA